MRGRAIVALRILDGLILADKFHSSEEFEDPRRLRQFPIATDYQNLQYLQGAQPAAAIDRQWRRGRFRPIYEFRCDYGSPCPST
jgi:hypothetical protein